MPPIIFVVITLILIYLFINWQNAGKGVYNSIVEAVGIAYEKYAPYSFKQIRSKIKELGQEYTVKQYTTQVLLYAGGAALVSYFYFYNIIVSIVYALAAVCVVPYLSYLRTKRLYSEFVFEQIQTYTTNTIMEFATTQSFVKAIEGVYESGVLEDPVKSDVKIMIDLAYKNGSIEQSIEYFNSKYDYFIVLSIKNNKISYKIHYIIQMIVYIFLIFMCKRCRFPRCIYPTASLPIPAIILHTMTPHTVGISAARAVHLTLPVSFFMVRSVVAHGQCIR